MSKLRSDMDEMELVLDQWDLLRSEMHKFGELNEELAEYGEIAHKGYIINDPSYLINWERNIVNRLSACMKLAAYTLAGQFAMLPTEKCKWIQCSGGYDGDYNTECDNFFILDNQTDGMDFCIFCGKRIEFCLDEPEDDEDIETVAEWAIRSGDPVRVANGQLLKNEAKRKKSKKLKQEEETITESDRKAAIDLLDKELSNLESEVVSDLEETDFSGVQL